MNHFKKYVLLLVSLLIAGGLYCYIRNAYSYNQVIGPIGRFSQAISNKRYQEGRQLFITFKDEVTNDQVLRYLEELKQITGVNGSSFQSSIETGKPQLSLDVVDISLKPKIIQIIQQNPLVDKVTVHL